MDTPLDPASWQAAGSTSLVLIALTAAIVELLVGIAVGWWLRGGKTSPAQNQTDGQRLPGDQHKSDLQEAQNALSNLQELAQRVKADVGAHSSQVEAISNQLNAQQTGGSMPETKVLEAVTKILAANEQLEQRLHSAESKLQQQAEQIKVHAANALTDALTGLGNRRAFDIELPRRIAEFQRQGTPFCLLMLDVDHFKKFNDLHGHLAGDEVLRMVGKTLKNTVRTPDFVARYGGEEFAVVMPQTTAAEALESAQRVRAGIQQAACQFEGQKLSVTVSIGVAEIATGQSPLALVQFADEALYAAKQAGRNQVKRYLPLAAATPDATTAVANTSREAPTPSSSAQTNLVQSSAGRSSSELPSVDARTDVQTGLPNRTAFCEEIHRRLSEAQRHGNRLSLMLIKIDNFGQLIQQHGPHVVDLVLHTCTQFLTAAMRDMDMVARYDADMFGIVLPGTALPHAAGAGQRLRAAIEQCPLRSRDKDIRFTISAGAAEAQPGEDLVSFINRTEDAQAAAAATGGNTIRFHTGVSVDSLPQDAGAVA